jgi:hypothetical protein
VKHKVEQLYVKEQRTDQSDEKCGRHGHGDVLEDRAYIGGGGDD